jgi:purine-cytosine permease-like protein
VIGSFVRVVMTTTAVFGVVAPHLLGLLAVFALTAAFVVALALVIMEQAR